MMNMLFLTTILSKIIVFELGFNCYFEIQLNLTSRNMLFLTTILSKIIVFELDSKFGIPNLTTFGDLSNKEMMWVITEVVTEPNMRNRAKLIKDFIKVITMEN